MPLLEITQSRQISVSVRLDEVATTQMDQFAAFNNASAEDVVEKALNMSSQRSRITAAVKA